jgi:hypothetical protein
LAKAGGRRSRFAGMDRVQQLAKDVAEAKVQGKVDTFATRFHARYGELLRAFGADSHGFLLWTEDLLQYGAGIGFSVLIKLAEEGDREAAVQLVKLYKGEPVQRFEHRIAAMTADDAEAEAIRTLMKSGKTEAEAKAFFRALEAGTEVEAPGRVIEGEVA